ncbi:MAG: hypothetical protein LQ340_005154 [Diploschistes diacapsis]|nr:MAG: hypothetical protein LQ340_005154 [Diploschistes diacapsis]
MFLDRFSNHPTPSASPAPSQRSYSPAPRRPGPLGSGLSRPSLQPRSSSLTSLVSRANSSIGSLPGIARLPNGSGLKQSTAAPPDVDDPFEVLEKIVGVSLQRSKEDGNDGASTIQKPDELLDDIDFGTLSLQDFVESRASNKSSIEVDGEMEDIQSVEEYESERDKFEDLHRSIQACDNVLKSVEISLAGFQKDLGIVSMEIETLQTKSAALNARLENRKKVERLLGPAVEEVSIAPAVVQCISIGQMDDNWLKALAELQKRLKAIETKANGSENIKAMTDIRPLLEGLTSKATERIRDYLVAQIKAMRSPNINAQIIQQQNLVRYKDLWGFLMKNNTKLSGDIGQAYINTMRWYYLNNFTRYQEALNRLSIIRIGQTETIGADSAAPRQKSPGMPASHDAHNIGRRADILKTSNTTAISSYAAEEDKNSHYIETSFRSFNLALIDNISAEYSFLTGFFHTDTYAQMSRRCASIFEPTFALGQTLATDLISQSYDCIGILLCVRLTQAFAFELQRRKVPVAESYLNGMNMLLWPRLQLAMDAHSESIKQASATVSARSAASKLSFTGPSAADQTKLSTAPHPLTQRFSQFLYGILAVSKDAGDDEPVTNSLRRLRGEYEAFLQKASKGAGADQRKRDRFLSNNYALVMTIIADAQGKLAEEQKEHFEELSEGLRR